MSQIAVAHASHSKCCHSTSQDPAAQAHSQPNNKRDMSQIAVAHAMLSNKCCHNAAQAAVAQLHAPPNNNRNTSQVAVPHAMPKKCWHNACQPAVAQTNHQPNNNRNLSQVAVAHALPQTNAAITRPKLMWRNRPPHQTTNVTCPRSRWHTRYQEMLQQHKLQRHKRTAARIPTIAIKDNPMTTWTIHDPCEQPPSLKSKTNRTCYLPCPNSRRFYDTNGQQSKLAGRVGKANVPRCERGRACNGSSRES